MPDKMEELQSQQDELKKTLKVVETIITSPEWKWLENILTTNIGIQRRAEFDRSMDSLDAAFASAQARGVIRGLELAVTTPFLHKESVEADLEHISAQIEDEQNE